MDQGKKPFGLHDLRPAEGSKKKHFRVEYAVVNVDRIADVFEAGAVVTPEILREKGLLQGHEPKVKVLARGDVSKALTVKAHKFSGKAAEKIAAAGGTAEVLS